MKNSLFWTLLREKKWEKFLESQAGGEVKAFPAQPQGNICHVRQTKGTHPIKRERERRTLPQSKSC